MAEGTSPVIQLFRNWLLHPEVEALTKFAVVGATAFVADATMLSILVYGFGLGPLVGRLISAPFAVTITWLINRRWTFRSRNSDGVIKEAGKYFASRIVGAIANFAVYAAIIHFAPRPFSEPIIATALSAAMTMLVNYALVRRFMYFPKGLQSQNAGTGDRTT